VRIDVQYLGNAA